MSTSRESKSFSNDTSIDGHLKSDQKFFVDARADAAKFLKESFDFRKKFLFYTHVLQANAEKTREEKSHALDEINVESARMQVPMIIEPFMNESTTD